MRQRFAFTACCLLAFLLVSAAPGQQTTAGPKAETPKGFNELLLLNLAGILGGIAAIVAAWQSRKNNKESQERTRTELSTFKRDLRNELVDGETIRIIAKLGDFLSERELKEALIESIEKGRIKVELLEVERRLAEAERKIQDNAGKIFTLEQGEQLKSTVNQLMSVLTQKGK